MHPKRLFKMREKLESTPDALRRNPLNKYTEGWFHVTLNVRDEAPVLGYLEGHPDAPDGSPDAPRCVLTPLGRKVEEAFHRGPSINPFHENVAFQIMPEHLHMLLHLKPGNKKLLGQIVAGFMGSCSHGYWDILGIDWRNMSFPNANASPGTDGKPLSGKELDRDRDHSRSLRGPSLFVHGYNDVEALTPESVAIKCQYIQENPRRRLIKSTHRDRFLIHRDARSANWTLERALGAIAADPWIGRSPEKCLLLQQRVASRLKYASLPSPSGASSLDAPHSSAQRSTLIVHRSTLGAPTAHPLVLDYLGNTALLSASRKVSLICHRADASLFAQQASAVLSAARQGAVVVSAFISPREREIRDQLMLEQLPFIELMDNGFSERYKPSGKAFYSTAENRHVQLTCWTYVYPSGTSHASPSDAPSLDAPHSSAQRSTLIVQRPPLDPPTGPSITREMCLVMNELARLISGVPDDWWKTV